MADERVDLGWHAGKPLPEMRMGNSKNKKIRELDSRLTAFVIVQSGMRQAIGVAIYQPHE
jgi:hypothetical protein